MKKKKKKCGTYTNTGIATGIGFGTSTDNKNVQDLCWHNVEKKGHLQYSIMLIFFFFFIWKETCQATGIVINNKA